ncbi:methyltransferase PMT23 [Pyrus ussuriensis x Pyrus communis]|uniref:Methyltransferase PMT23 n=1 Tax=Pyrus ussuriensis x Pyrus communis TaxID=2448454 RepID=A0A5N5GPT6_9ROSA|nr:methyltransferase PMT23 [Pyrus ussuriensis x Pyrus communis]
MGISVPSFFEERKFQWESQSPAFSKSESSLSFSLLLPLTCITIILFTNTTTNVPYPHFFYSDLQTSPSSSQPISPPAPSNPAVPGAGSQRVQGAGSVASEQGHGEICTLVRFVSGFSQMGFVDLI